jgi:hypothetical protein
MVAPTFTDAEYKKYSVSRQSVIFTGLHLAVSASGEINS